MSRDRELQLYNIKKLLNNKYVIPIYQRNFAWSEGEIRQLILDIFDYSIDNSNKDYYIGTLIVYDRKNNFEIIDGQQRLTTLSILLSLIKNEYEDKYKKYMPENYNLNLTFDSRKNSTETLQALYNKNENDIEKYINENSNSITEGYNICKKVLTEILNKDKEDKFFEYLFINVNILQVTVLEDTDLNHYFEIMNSRGEQLEMHEILKARLLEKLDDKSDKDSENNKFIFNLIWEACSNMERYIQFGFKKDLRDIIFQNDWNSLISEKELYSRDYKDNNSNIDKEAKTIEYIINPENKISDGKSDKEDNEEQELFNSIINFPNFLLHVLKIQVSNKNEDIPLDDKRLLGTFNKFLKNKDNSENEKEKIKNFVKSFGYNLLKIKFLFDKYIIKRELKSDNWSLKQLKLYVSKNKQSNYYKDSFSKNDDEEDDKGINKKILMLLSMFHTSYPTLVYKNWLNDVLKYLYDNEENIKAEDYKNELKKLAKERYNNIITANGEDILNEGTGVPHFIFNYLDYLLWEDGTYEKYLGDNKTFIGKINNFKFTFRSSVEHYYPQHPIIGKPLCENIDENKKILNKFGNLCLISRSKNSKLSNNTPTAKKDYYINNDIDSIKQAIMMSYNNWGIEEIEKHSEEMKDLLKLQL